MRKLLVLAGIALLPLFANAQEISFPKAEVFAGFSYLRLEKTDNIGWNGSLTGNINKNLGIVFDLSGYYNSRNEPIGGIPANTDASFHSILVGPRVSDPRGNWVPFAQALLGWSRVNQETSTRGITGTAFSSTSADNAFGFAAGGGMDYRLSDGTALRLVQVDYMMFRSGGVRLEGARISGGIIFTFGRRSM